MESKLKHLLISHNISVHRNQGILIAPVQTISDGIRLAKDVLYTLVDSKTALFLSGGKTPKELYKRIAQEKKLHAGVVGVVDERFGARMHENSNERMVKESGLLDYLQESSIQFYSMPTHEAASEAANKYDELVRSLFTVYPTSVATLGIGTDGHTAGIAPNRADFINPLFEKKREVELVSEFTDADGKFGERITMTFLGLSMMDYLIVLVFGDDKKKALEDLFDEGKEQEIPARFLKREEIAAKTVIITDQEV